MKETNHTMRRERGKVLHDLADNIVLVHKDVS